MTLPTSNSSLKPNSNPPSRVPSSSTNYSSKNSSKLSLRQTPEPRVSHAFYNPTRSYTSSLRSKSASSSRHNSKHGTNSLEVDFDLGSPGGLTARPNSSAVHFQNKKSRAHFLDKVKTGQKSIKNSYQSGVHRKRFGLKDHEEDSELDLQLKSHLRGLLRRTITCHDEFSMRNNKPQQNRAAGALGASSRDSRSTTPFNEYGWDIRSMNSSGDRQSIPSIGKGFHLHHATFAGSDMAKRFSSPLDRFRSAAKKLVVLYRVCMTFRLYVRDTHGHMVFHQMNNNTGANSGDAIFQKQQGALPPNTRNTPAASNLANKGQQNNKFDFDLSDFKSHAEFKFPKRGQIICNKEPFQRTANNIQELRRLMLTLDSFRAYDTNIQTSMCKRLRYAKYERRPLVIRKGHIAKSLYFIFSGKVGVASDTEGASVFTEAEPIILSKGAVFGETGLIKGIKRNCSIVCTEATEFLVIDKDDFIALDLFDMYKKVESKDIQERFNYFRVSPLFKNCTNDELNMLSQTCKSQFFIHNQVIVKDSTKTETINFIKSGRVGVVRLLQLDSCLAFKQALVESGSFPKIHKLGQTIRDPADFTQMRTENIIRQLRVPDLNFSTFMQVDQLQSGQVFGLETIAYPDNRIFSLVSEGCELLRVPKNVVIDLVGKNYLKNCIRKYNKPYPSDEELSKLFLAMNHWRFYRDHVVKRVVDESILSRLNSSKNLLRDTSSPNENTTSNRTLHNSTENMKKRNNLYQEGIEDWLKGCVKMPWSSNSIKNMDKYMALGDPEDAKGEYKTLKEKIYSDAFEAKAATATREGGQPASTDEAVRRQAKLLENKKQSFECSLSQGQLDSLKLVDNLDEYDPRERAKFLRKEVETLERKDKMDGDILKKRGAVDSKNRNERGAINQGGNDQVSRLIQGISLPTFKLSSF